MEGKTKTMLNKILVLLGIFTVGFLTSLSLGFSLSNSENPLSYSSSSEIKAPSDFINEKNIEVYEDKVIIRLDDASLSGYAPTGSMKPFFDKGANGIRIVPKSEEDIHVGDIITFERDAELIVHRVMEKGEDEFGIYFITRGDNNNSSDGKIRFSEIRYLTVAILY